MSTEHVHVFPVDPSLTVEEAWREQCLMGVRATFTGDPKWATMKCDGEECWRIAMAAQAEHRSTNEGYRPR